MQERWLKSVKRADLQEGNDDSDKRIMERFVTPPLTSTGTCASMTVLGSSSAATLTATSCRFSSWLNTSAVARWTRIAGHQIALEAFAAKEDALMCFEISFDHCKTFVAREPEKKKCA